MSNVQKPTIRLTQPSFRVPKATLAVAELSRGALRAKRNEVLVLPNLRERAWEEIGEVHTFDGEPPGELAIECCREVLAAADRSPGKVSLIIDFSTVSRAPNGLSLGYAVQHALDARDALVLAIGNGSCTSFQLALKTAVAFLRSSSEHTHALLFSEDRLRGERFNPPVNVLGDGASAALLDVARPGLELVGSKLISVGRFWTTLGIHHFDESNFSVDEFENRIVPLHYRVLRDLMTRVLKDHDMTREQIGLVLYQNMSARDYDGLAGALDLPKEIIFTAGLAGHGHIFGADLLINLCLAKRAGLLRAGQLCLMLSSGAGFAWAADIFRVEERG